MKKKTLPNSFLLFVQQEMDNLYPCYMALLYFFQPYVHLFKIADKDFCLFMKKIESRITVYEKCVFHVFFNYFLFSLWCCLYSTCTFWLTMLILPFFIIKHKKSRIQGVTLFCGSYKSITLCCHFSPMKILWHMLSENVFASLL